MKSECREFKKWKDDKDADRKRRGLPPFQPRPVAAVDPAGDNGGGSDYEAVLDHGAGAGMLDIGSLGCDALGVLGSDDGSSHSDVGLEDFEEYDEDYEEEYGDESEGS